MEGVGGAHQEVTWQRYNGVRRSKFIAEDDAYEGALVEAPPPIDTRDRGRRFVGQKSKTEGMWTEITKDLVSEEAMKEMGYEFEATEFFYYVMKYLRYVSFSTSFPVFDLFYLLTLTRSQIRRTSNALWISRKTSKEAAADESAKCNSSGKQSGQRNSSLSVGMKRRLSSGKSSMTDHPHGDTAESSTA